MTRNSKVSQDCPRRESRSRTVHRQNSHLHFNHRATGTGLIISGAPNASLAQRNTQRLEDQATRVFLVIGGLHITCHSLRTVLSLAESISMNYDSVHCPTFGKTALPFYLPCLQEFSQILLVINHSCKLGIYCMTNKMLRGVMCKLFRRTREVPVSQSSILGDIPLIPLETIVTH